MKQRLRSDNWRCRRKRPERRALLSYKSELVKMKPDGRLTEMQ